MYSLTELSPVCWFCEKFTVCSIPKNILGLLATAVFSPVLTFVLVVSVCTFVEVFVVRVNVFVVLTVDVGNILPSGVLA